MPTDLQRSTVNPRTKITPPDFRSHLQRRPDWCQDEIREPSNNSGCNRRRISDGPKRPDEQRQTHQGVCYDVGSYGPDECLAR